MLIRQLLCPAVSALNIRSRLADVYKNRDDSIKSIALFEQGNADGCIQATE